MFLEFLRLFGIFLGYPVQLIFFKKRVFYEDGVKPELRRGGKLIIMNHYNMWDYVLSCFLVFPRKLNVIASEHAFKNKAITAGVKVFGGIQANRITKNMKFVDLGAEVIKGGGLLEIFPEGRNTPDGKMHEFKPSYLVIAHRAGCKIVPMITDGNYGLFKRTSVIIGKELDVSEFFTEGVRTPSREELARADAYVYSKMVELRNTLEELKTKRKRVK